MPIFYYFSKSANSPPGRGVNEEISGGEESDYETLSKIPQLRKVLSNFHIGELVYLGKSYKTAEHAFQGHKIALVDKSKGDLFALESRSDIARGDGEVARRNRKLVILLQQDLKQWDDMKEQVMEDIMRCKFSQVSEAKTILLATKHAELWHGSRGIPNTRQRALETVREQLQRETDVDDTVVSTVGEVSGQAEYCGAFHSKYQATEVAQVILDNRIVICEL